MSGLLPRRDAKLAADRHRPAEVVQYGAVAVRRLHQLAHALLRRRAADHRRVADGAPARRHALVYAKHAAGVVVRLDGHFDAVERDIEHSRPHHVAHRQAAAEAGADEHAGVGTQASAAVARHLVGDELPGAILDVAGDAAADLYDGRRCALPDRWAQLQRLDVALLDSLNV